MEKYNGRLIKGVGGNYEVEVDNEIMIFSSRKKTKIQGNFMIGDICEVDLKTKTIEKVLVRKNQLIRPPISNIDNLLILISSEPQPDYMLIDKMIVHARYSGITPYILVNKIDLGIEELRKTVKEDYSNAVEQIFEMTIFDHKTTAKLEEVLSSGITCLVGQSAVGKTSILNLIKNENKTEDREVGELSKIKRGRHTTRHSEILKTVFGGYVIDTPGFSFLTLEIDEKDLIYYYMDFFKYQNDCHFRACLHINEPKCMVKKKMEEGEISKNRYQRYLKLYEELKKRRENQYG